MKEEKSTLYSYAIIAQPIHDEKKYLWQKVGRYKRLSSAEKALEDFNKEELVTLIYKLVPYFSGYWFVDEEARNKAFIKTNSLLWNYLKKKGLTDEAREYIKLNREL